MLVTERSGKRHIALQHAGSARQSWSALVSACQLWRSPTDPIHAQPAVARHGKQHASHGV
eukprot:15459252-Alexandrium_andersonii.AAC.1